MNILQKNIKETSKQFSGHNRLPSEISKAIANIPNIDDQLDTYGTGTVIENFEQRIATLLGKKSACFYPSGIMAQQNALRIYCDNSGINQVLLHPLSHLEGDEMNALKELQGIDSILLGDDQTLFRIEDLEKVSEPYSAILIELPNRRMGGKVLTWDELLEINEYAKQKGIKLHLDGARLWEIQPYFNKTFAEICALFDSVYVSLYKGLSGISGAVLLGEPDFIATAKTWQKRSGGTLISHYPAILSADIGMTEFLPKMSHYWSNAKTCAVKFNAIKGVNTLPKMPTSLLFHVYFEKNIESVTKALSETYDQTGIVISGHLKSD